MHSINVDSEAVAQTSFEMGKSLTQFLFEFLPKSEEFAVPMQALVYPRFFEFLSADRAIGFPLRVEVLKESLHHNIRVGFVKYLTDAANQCVTEDICAQLAQKFGAYEYDIYDMWNQYDDIHTIKGVFTAKQVHNEILIRFCEQYGKDDPSSWTAFTEHKYEITTLVSEFAPQIIAHMVQAVAANTLAQAEEYCRTIEETEQQQLRRDTVLVEVNASGIEQRRKTPPPSSQAHKL